MLPVSLERPRDQITAKPEVHWRTLAWATGLVPAAARPPGLKFPAHHLTMGPSQSASRFRALVPLAGLVVGLGLVSWVATGGIGRIGQPPTTSPQSSRPAFANTECTVFVWRREPTSAIGGIR